MKNPLTLLGRLFSRSEAPIVSQLYTHAIGQPLLVHLQLGEALIGAYMSGAVDVRGPLLEVVAPTGAAPSDQASTKSIAVLNISGALVNRETPGVCGPGPLSYAEIRKEFDEMLADDSVAAIVMRMETPGGMVAGCFDLAEHIAASRGKKPIYAMLDDYAYSAGYAIASAADERWATRSAGAGSVGAVGFHIDESAKLAGEGKKITPVFSGAHKIDMSSHAPLADSVREQMQERVNKIRVEFAELVAANIGMDFDAVMATEAQVYTGKDALAVGFVDRIGTMRDLIAHIGEQMAEPAEESAPVAQPPAAAPAPVAAALPSIEQLAAAFVSTVTASALPAAVAMQLLKRKPPEDAAQAVADAESIVDYCTAAKVPDLATSFIESSTSPEAARTQLVDLLAEVGPEIVTSLPSGDPPKTANPLGVQGIYESRKVRSNKRKS